MAKIKHTKNELKAQRDSLRRFERYLPTLQLKKQQLQIEVRDVEAKIREKGKALNILQDQLSEWIGVYAGIEDLEPYLCLQRIQERSGNVAGVNIPILEEIEFKRSTPDLFSTPSWLDDALQMIEEQTRLWVEVHVLRQQHRLLFEELRVTTQRVNLFEKVKIPETKEHIRVIRIFLGDQQTASVARAKIAKSKGD